ATQLVDRQVGNCSKVRHRPHSKVVIITTECLSVRCDIRISSEMTMRNQAKIAQLLTPAAEFTHHVMASAQVAICVLDSEGRFATLSPRGVAVTGYPLEELCGKPCTFLVIASDRARMERIVESVVTKGKTVGQIETTILCKDGTPKVVRFDIGPLRVGSNIIGAVATGEDISATRRAE